MNRFFATFISGTQAIVEAMLRERLKDLRLLSLLDGGVEFETALPYSDLNLFCFNNIFQVLHRLEDCESLDGSIRRLFREEVDWSAAGRNSKKQKTFRLVTSCQNRLTAVEPSLRNRLEKQLAQCSGLRVDRSRPDTEFWLLSRSEGFCYLLKRLSRHTAYDKLLNPGELHPELAFMMCWLSGPKHTDVVLDPFCGYGSIPAQRCRRFPLEKFYAFDSDETVLKRAGQKLGKREHLVLEAHDVLTLDRVLPPDSVDAVITDPPWGLYRDVGMELEEFYRRTAVQLERLLKPGGRLVLLTAKKEEFLQAAQAADTLFPRQRYDILVSGKKTGLFVYEKRPF